MTAAVPAPKASLRLPFSAAAVTSSMDRGRSETLTPQSFRIRITESRVMPGRMDPLRGAVITSSLITKKMFMVPTSSTYFRSAASSQSTCV